MAVFIPGATGHQTLRRSLPCMPALNLTFAPRSGPLDEHLARFRQVFAQACENAQHHYALTESLVKKLLNSDFIGSETSISFPSQITVRFLLKLEEPVPESISITLSGLSELMLSITARQANATKDDCLVPAIKYLVARDCLASLQDLKSKDLTPELPPLGPYKYNPHGRPGSHTQSISSSTSSGATSFGTDSSGNIYFNVLEQVVMQRASPMTHQPAAKIPTTILDAQVERVQGPVGVKRSPGQMQSPEGASAKKTCVDRRSDYEELRDTVAIMHDAGLVRGVICWAPLPAIWAPYAPALALDSALTIAALHATVGNIDHRCSASSSSTTTAAAAAARARRFARVKAALADACLPRVRQLWGNYWRFVRQGPVGPRSGTPSPARGAGATRTPAGLLHGVSTAAPAALSGWHAPRAPRAFEHRDWAETEAFFARAA